MTDKLTLAVNHAMAQAQVAQARMGLLYGGYGLDDKRKCSAWHEYGWPVDVSYEMLFGLYRRGGLAHGAVNKVIGTIWKTNPWVIEGNDQDDSRPETAWEKSANQVLTARVWRVFAEADRRRLVGRYSGLLLHINDGQPWNQPVKTKGKALVRVTPAWASALTPTRFDTDEDSPTYGQPTEWQYQETRSSGTVGRRVKIHPDRVFILGDWGPGAIGWLEPAYNAFVSLEKVEGGSGESFLKNAARQLNINFDKEIDFANLASMYGVPVQELQDRFNEVAVEINRGNDTVLPTQGASVTPLVTSVPDPRPTYDINLQTVSAALDIPSRILVGNQQGERASTEDQRYFNASRQADRMERSFEIEDFVDHLIHIGVLGSVGEKSVMWDDLNEQTATERLDSAEKMSRINQAAMMTGEIVFDSNEIRTAAGYDPTRGLPLGEELDDDDETAPADSSE